jgi:hypothetical protein
MLFMVAGPSSRSMSRCSGPCCMPYGPCDVALPVFENSDQFVRERRDPRSRARSRRSCMPARPQRPHNCARSCSASAPRDARAAAHAQATLLAACAARAAAHAHAARTLALLVQLRMLTQRTCSRSAHVRATAHAHAVRTHTQCFSGARYLRSWTRCRRSDRAPPLTGSHFLSLLSISLTTKHHFDPALDEVCVRLAPASVVSPRAPSTGVAQCERVVPVDPKARRRSRRHLPRTRRSRACVSAQHKQSVLVDLMAPLSSSTKHQ